MGCCRPHLTDSERPAPPAVVGPAEKKNGDQRELERFVVMAIFIAWFERTDAACIRPFTCFAHVLTAKSTFWNHNFHKMAFATPFSSFDQPPCWFEDSLREFFLDSVRWFEEGVASKLTTINLPCRSFKPERSISVEGVHPFVFVDSFGKKIREEEIRHHPPCDNLHYEVDSLAR